MSKLSSHQRKFNPLHGWAMLLTIAILAVLAAPRILRLLRYQSGTFVNTGVDRPSIRCYANDNVEFRLGFTVYHLTDFGADCRILQTIKRYRYAPDKGLRTLDDSTPLPTTRTDRDNSCDVGLIGRSIKVEAAQVGIDPRFLKIMIKKERNSNEVYFNDIFSPFRI